MFIRLLREPNNLARAANSGTQIIHEDSLTFQSEGVVAMLVDFDQ